MALSKHTFSSQWGFIAACWWGDDMDKLEHYLSRDDVDVNAKSEEGEYAILVACTRGHGQVVELLIEHKADLYLTDDDGATPLCKACERGYMDVSYLIECGSDVNHMNIYGATPISIAAWNGHVKVVKTLLEHKADLSQTHPRGTPLEMAYQNKQFEVATVIQQHMALPVISEYLPDVLAQLVGSYISALETDVNVDTERRKRKLSQPQIPPAKRGQRRRSRRIMKQAFSKKEE
jgi:hypothetical protein